jgi:hypothetical protein
MAADAAADATTDELARQFSELAELSGEERRAALAEMPPERRLQLQEYNKKVRHSRLPRISLCPDATPRVAMRPTSPCARLLRPSPRLQLQDYNKRAVHVRLPRPL